MCKTMNDPSCPNYIAARKGRYVFYHFHGAKYEGGFREQTESKDKKMQEEIDNDVTSNFLNVIRKKRRDKYGRMLYGTDGNIEENFDAEGYFKELIVRNKIRDKLKRARERRSTMFVPDDSDEDEEEEEHDHKINNTATLLNRITRKSNSTDINAEGSNLPRGDSILESKDSGKGTPSGDTIQSYNDGSTRHNSPAKTMKNARLKLQAVKTFSSACDQLKHRYKKERESQMELLETIRQLRGINKDDFYEDIDRDTDSEDEAQIMHKHVVTKNQKNKNQKQEATKLTAAKRKQSVKVEKVESVIAKSNVTVKRKEKIKNTEQKKVEVKTDLVKNERVTGTETVLKKADFAASERVTGLEKVDVKTEDNERVTNTEKGETIDESVPLDNENNEGITIESENDGKLSPIANQCLTPDRIPSPDCSTPTPNVSPDIDDELNRSQSPASENISPSPILDHNSPSPVIEHNSPQLVVAEVHVEKPPPIKKKKKNKHLFLKTSGCRVDSRWPKGHKLFTKPTLDDENSDHTDCFACYEKETNIHFPVVKRPDLQKRKRKSVKPKVYQDHDQWRETLMRIAYEKEFAYLKKRSLHLFPFKKSALDTMISLDTRRSKTSLGRIGYMTPISNRTHKGTRRETSSLKLKNKTDQRELKFQSLSENHEPEVVVRSTSGHASNDQGYDSDDDIEHSDPRSNVIHNSRVNENNRTSEIGENSNQKQTKSKL